MDPQQFEQTLYQAPGYQYAAPESARQLSYQGRGAPIAVAPAPQTSRSKPLFSLNASLLGNKRSQLLSFDGGKQAANTGSSTTRYNSSQNTIEVANALMTPRAAFPQQQIVVQRKSMRGLERYGTGKSSYSKQRAQKNQPPLMISKDQ